MKKFPVWTMSKANKDENEKVKGSKKVRVQTPGPGHYHSKYGNIPNGPQYSMAKKLPKKKKEERPGPGNYNIQYLHRPSEPKYTFGKEKCNIFKNEFPDQLPQSSIKVTQMPGGNSRVRFASQQ